MAARAIACALVLVLAAGCAYTGGWAGDPAAGPAGAPSCEVPTPKLGPGEIFVYLVRADAGRRDPGDRRNFVAVPRLLEPERRAAPLRASVDELLEGPTPRERRDGCISTFDDDAHVLRRVELRDGQAVVDFHRRAFRAELGIVSASYAGAVFGSQLDLTIFQFQQVESIRYELDGDCEAFGEFMQVGECIVVRRSR